MNILFKCFTFRPIGEGMQGTRLGVRRFNNKKGFTLVELLIVIAIIGILSGVVLASMGSARAKARDGRRISDIKQIQLALATYQDANGSYPTAIYGSPSPLASYMSSIPTDPSTAAQYKYAYYNYTGPNPKTYHLGAVLETEHSELSNTVNCDSSDSSGGCPGAAVYSGAPFNGKSDDCGETSNDAGSSPKWGKCYDVTP
ncbi:MAG: hypothetical protein A3H57_01590 [Candidatus Taylorbacteria bacterium RIFCSPLOWO2_02_FULL_43_11]|uniref:Type II secretion system protein GspG C-terminal domain-containing protein n=1 Tax=Candidatus Taylorbacteria bacterium RIFCSPHIGHO2_02_FULL_43_32b TaxID=1802306 RepID=A0A1G2MG81_9BACT|nr:MAG: hypothetical protein A2743_02860 [Candidatus Taylorbacteria bacterium RIFCSPHIGHO2_01_FULL_43_47]OHA22169.1 MAG: hypothetical protein A3C72_02330 [Candidatus Taylorbacteria bacterium RIFCSPHIGHO2_02_FULL_43_32b]OHA28865.1 MAG: hypothetical protein A3B08_02100 [Candidatus Taylorbacteria bacterium RIFCSPLOWO2_01_FULL_43_44]OHA36067.1 MAG: hypothetical protein A3H57_01590 [Candidatus Taylorbacteria bacterium RIFCSPLOWO2_02_FULL_43_11]